MSDAILRFEDVTREYSMGEAKAYGLRSLTVEFESGEFAAVVGPSGSGKSTLQHLGAGFDRPSSGKVFLMGRDLGSCPDRELARLRNKSIGFVFQSFNLLPVLSAAENVAYPALLYPARGEGRGSVERRALELLDRVGLSGKARKRPHQLSGGERQRVAIARALVNGPALVFADEPTANLDHATGAAVLDILEALNAERGSTLILATHDPEVMKRARRLVALKDGRLAQAERPSSAARTAGGGRDAGGGR
jgi:putative ABC transport system ATP-binding protein